MEQESKTEIEALREQVDQLTQMNIDMVAVVRKLTTDLNTLAQLVILGRGRYNAGAAFAATDKNRNPATRRSWKSSESITATATILSRCRPTRSGC